ncbi:hypothetical protein [Bifidobacterium sp. SO1]|uniref:hypothetical protein n=1 Tax=Bifidobacterium sp. SO1 TaxID=2809029 RepID=UPI001BDCC0DE|nr:hypothetical protein [Bifidobacterium sp. SO1]MBT1162866.1 hypothetical protein [Bifidobacterium sp. SO1]
MDTLTQQITSLIIRHRAELDPALSEDDAVSMIQHWMSDHGFESASPITPSGFEYAVYGDAREAATREDVDAIGWSYDTLSNHVAVLDDLLTDVSLGVEADQETRSAIDNMRRAARHLSSALHALGWNGSGQ